MAKRQKGKEPNAEQKQILRREGYDPRLALILQDYPASMIVRFLDTNLVTMIKK